MYYPRDRMQIGGGGMEVAQSRRFITLTKEREVGLANQHVYAYKFGESK